MPLFAQYQTLFDDDPNMRHVLELNFQDVLEFHRRAVKYFKRPVWKQMFHATWKQFNTKFGDIINNIHQHKILLERQASLTEFEQAKQARLLTEREFRSLEAQEILRRKGLLATWLAAADVRSDQEEGRLTRHNYPQSGRWLLAKPQFRTWLDPKSYSAPLLWIHGKPGSGTQLY